MEIKNEIQYSLDTWEPDGFNTSFIFAGAAGESKTWFIPCRPTLRHWQVNQYNTYIRGMPLIVDPREPFPTGRIQIAVYRSLIPTSPVGIGVPWAVQIPSTLYDTTTVGPLDVIAPDFEDTLQLGGSYWIVIRVTNATESGPNIYQWALSAGWTLADVNLWHQIYEDNANTGALPATYTYVGIVPCTGDYPWIRCDYV